MTISVVIPARNRAATIAACLDSVTRQTVPVDEILVVDDASTDNTVEIARAHGATRIVRLAQQSGAQAARNEGIRQARGEWIAFLDSDDEWLPHKLARQTEILATVHFDPRTFLHSNCVYIDHARGTRTESLAEPIEGPNAYHKLLRGPGPMFQSMLVSKAALQAIGYLDERVPSFQEWDTAIRLAKECDVIHIREPLFLYHLHGGDTISKDRRRDIDGYAYVIGKFEQEIRTVCGAGAWDDHLLRQAVRSLEFGFWETAGEYLGRLSTRNARVRALQLCRYLHLSPATVLRPIGMAGKVFRRVF